MPPKKANTSWYKPKTACRELINTKKGMILAFFYSFQTISTVAQLVSGLWSTVRNFLARACERESIENAPQAGRPTLLSRREKSTIIWAAKNDRDMTHLELRNRYAPHVSIRTIDRVLREANVRKWLAQKRPKLKDQQVKARLA